jgi:hypothetical protein
MRERTFEDWEAAQKRGADPRRDLCPCGARDAEHERWCGEYRRLGATGASRIADERARALGGRG